MAAVFVPPSPQTAFAMSNRRVPLANVPNAANSPQRAGPLAVKRRSQIDIPYGQPPPKKQLLEHEETESKSPTKSRVPAYPNTDAKFFSRRLNNVQLTAFEKKLVAAKERERQSLVRVSRNERPADTLDTIRQWQKHYRKAFPQFVFYFDSITEDVRYKCSRQCMALGASEEKFFSRLVTHVVTSRPIPPENELISPTETLASPEVEQSSLEGLLQTVNPSLLEKNSDPNAHLLLRSRPSQDKRSEFDFRREGGNMDVLHRARQMGMKIWALEKLQRMITAINDGDNATHGHFTRSHNAGISSRARGDTELSQVLRNELIHGTSDRDSTSWAKDMIIFKGPFIYVHDTDERNKPVMAREYPKVAKRQDGAWPQFRSAPLGKCPFIDEPLSKKELTRLKKEKKGSTKEAADILKELQEAKAKVAREEEVQQAKEGYSANISRAEPGGISVGQNESQNNDASFRAHLPRKSSESFIVAKLTRTGPFHLGREPAASGVQPSNITSAIRSQMLSSTAAAPGAKAGVSKEVHELKRKVLERGSGLVSTSTVPSSHRPIDASQPGRSVINASTRSNKNRPDERTTQKADKETQSEDNASGVLRAGNQRGDSGKRTAEKKRDPKPGYCENCRDKFDDFDEKHIMTRKHRKFAITMSNWAELDALIYHLQRPLKKEFDCL